MANEAIVSVKVAITVKDKAYAKNELRQLLKFYQCKSMREELII